METIYEDQDAFYWLKKINVKTVKDILRYAEKHSLKKRIDMMSFNLNERWIKSDKNFNEILDLINKDSLKFFRIVLRKNMNLFGILSDKRTIKDMLEIVICWIFEGKREYFMSFLLDKKHLDELNKKYELTKK